MQNAKLDESQDAINFLFCIPLTYRFSGFASASLQLMIKETKPKLTFLP